MVTRVEHRVGLLAILLAALCIILSGWIIIGLCCFWVPCVIDDCKDVEHHCPNCGRIVGEYKRMG